MTRVLLLFLFLFSAMTLGQGLTISKRYTANNNQRFSLGIGTGLHNVASSSKIFPKDISGVGLSHLVGRLYSAKEFFTGFEIMNSVNIGAASYGKLFSKSASNYELDGFYIDSQLGLRYLHPLSDNFDLGGQMFVGYGLTFAGPIKNSLETKTIDLAWPLHFRIGPAGRLVLQDNLTLYFSLLYTLKDLGKSSLGTKILENTPIGGVNKHGLELPVGIMWTLNDNFSLFAEAAIALRNFRHQNLDFLATLDLGFAVDFKK